MTTKSKWKISQMNVNLQLAKSHKRPTNMLFEKLNLAN